MNMNLLLETGIVVIVGFLFGEIASIIKLPKISGYIIAGILLIPELTHILPEGYADKTSPLINIALSFITFSIGGSLSISKIRSSGKLILFSTLSEALFAYFFTCVFIFVWGYFILDQFSSWNIALAVSLLLASLAAPTDPSATLAVRNEYHAKGAVSLTILGIAAFDDIMGIILYTLTFTVAKLLLGSDGASITDSLQELTINIGGAILLGIAFGLVFNLFVRLFQKEKEGALIVVITGMLLLCYGSAKLLQIDELLSTMTLGAVVVNFNVKQATIFKIIERYTDELIFVVFFTLSGLHLDISVLSSGILLIAIYIIGRGLGKYSGIFVATSILKAPSKIKKYTAGGLFPQGGIVIGLALLLSKEEAFSKYSTLIIGIVIGAAVIHEIFGPLIAKYSLYKAGEI
jgi:Kef-type K+ transport system membrane component KefB